MGIIPITVSFIPRWRASHIFIPHAHPREVVGGDGSYELREPPAHYNGILGHEKAVLRPQNEYSWEDIDCISI
jgi:hypothetical protein